MEAGPALRNAGAAGCNELITCCAWTSLSDDGRQFSVTCGGVQEMISGVTASEEWTGLGTKGNALHGSAGRLFVHRMDRRQGNTGIAQPPEVVYGVVPMFTPTGVPTLDLVVVTHVCTSAVFVVLATARFCN